MADLLNRFQVIIAFLAAGGQVIVLYLNYRMIKFARQYSSQWASAFVVLFVGMAIAFLRRIFVILWGLGCNGWVGEALQWTDHVVLTVILTVIWIVFFTKLWKWWSRFFKEFIGIFPDNPDKLVLHSVKELEVHEPKKFVADVSSKRVVIEDAAKVVLEAKKVEVVKNKVEK